MGVAVAADVAADVAAASGVAICNQTIMLLAAGLESCEFTRQKLIHHHQ